MKNKLFRAVLGVLFISPLLVMNSCKEDIGIAESANASTKARAVYDTRSISFDRTTGTYLLADAVTDFGNMTTGWNESRAYITTNQCQIKVLANALSAASGMIAKYDIADGSEYSTTFKIKFHTDFEWCTGGKVGPGFFIGDGGAGGAGGSDGLGGSLRLVWHKHPTTGEVYFQAYAYHKDQPNEYGSSFGRFPATGSLNKNQWYTVTLYVKSNTGTNTDGRVKFIVDGTTVYDAPIRWTTDDTKRLVNRMEFATFRGGATADYMSSTDSYIYYNDLSWTRIAP